MKRILISLMSIGLVAGVGFAATQAFFSDTETSTGNILAAGEIDLKIDNTSYVTDSTGALVASPNTSWGLRDLTVEKFFDFKDLKPGDIGEDTISVRVGSNDAWLCAAGRITDDSDQTCTEPELGDDPTCANPNDGELAEDIYLIFWVDDGDNVFEAEVDGPLSSALSLRDWDRVGKITIADSSYSMLRVGAPVPGGTTFYLGKAWCFGALRPELVAFGDYPQGPLTLVGEPPRPIGTGFSCDGSVVDNAAQTDQVVGDIQFYAEQSRNNSTFTCETNYTPWPSTP